MSEIDRPKKKILSGTAIKVMGLLLWSAVMVLLGYVLSPKSDMENDDGRISTDSGSVETLPDEGATVSRGGERYIVTYKKVKESPEASSKNTSRTISDKNVNTKGRAKGNTNHKKAKEKDSEQPKAGEAKKGTPPSPPAQQSNADPKTPPSAKKTE